jgi:hypothetical protein
MSSSNRRVFIIQTAAATTALCSGAAHALAQKVEESEAKAVSLGYRHDSAKVDESRFPKHKAAEHCSVCLAWLGKPADPWADCDLMADRSVANGGWCSSYVKAK